MIIIVVIIIILIKKYSLVRQYTCLHHACIQLSLTLEMATKILMQLLCVFADAFKLVFVG